MKKNFVFIVCAVLILAFSGCSDSSDPAPPKSEITIKDLDKATLPANENAYSLSIFEDKSKIKKDPTWKETEQRPSLIGEINSGVSGTATLPLSKALEEGEYILILGIANYNDRLNGKMFITGKDGNVGKIKLSGQKVEVSFNDFLSKPDKSGYSDDEIVELCKK